MYSQASLSRLSGIPRRRVENLIEAGAIQGFQVAGEPRSFYSAAELENLRLLRPFVENNATIGLLKFLSETFRSRLLNAARYRREVAMARSGRATWVIVQVIPNGVFFEAEIFLATDSRKLGQISAGRTLACPSVPLVIIDLREALRPTLVNAA